MSTIPVGLQLFSVRDDLAKDLPGTLAAVAKMGYEGVEFAGYHGYQARELRRILDGNGLRCCGTHLDVEALLGDEFARTVEFSQALGNRNLVVASLPRERASTRAQWLQHAHLFAELAAKAKAVGMRIGYHNHAVEFQPVDGEMPWDTIFGNTSPEVVMQLDTGNAVSGGGDPIATLKRYPGRAVTIHLKEYKGGHGRAIIGEGDTRWDEIFALCEGAGTTEWYIIEQGSSKLTQLECVARCREALRRMGR